MVSVLTGCSGGVASTDPFGDPASSGGASSSSSSSSSGASGSSSTPVSASTAIDLAGVQKVLLSDGYCGGKAGVCYGTDAVEVDFAKSTVTRTACVERGSDPSTGNPLPTESKASTRSLTAAELQTVRDALAAVRFTNDVSKSYDGYMIAMTITSASGTQYYSPQATCGNERFKTVVAGFEGVKKAFYGL